MPEWLIAVGEWLDGLWEWFAAEAGPFSAVAAVVTAVIAVIALNSTARDSRDRSRPVVLASFRMAQHNDRAFDLVVHNYGPSAASDIEVRFDPPISDEARADRMTEILAERYDKRIPLLPPGSEIKNLWWSSRPESGSQGVVNALSTPDEVTMTIIYKGNRIRRYRETVKLDARWMKLDSSSVSSTSMPGRTKQIADALTKIAAETRTTRFLVRDIAEGLSEEENEVTTPTIDNLPTLLREWSGPLADLAVRLGLTEPQARRLVEALDEDAGANPTTGDIDVIGGGGGQIEPGRGSAGE